MDQEKPATKKGNITALVASYQRLAKQISDMEKKAYDIISGFETGSGGVWNEEEKAFLDMITLKNLFSNETWVYIVCDLIALKIANQPMKVYRKSIVDNEEKVELAENHPLQRVIENPNPLQSYFDMMYSHAIDLVLLGNGLIWKGQLNGSLWTIPAESIMLDFDKNEVLIGYKRYNFVSYAQPLQLVKSFSAQEMIHSKRPNPSNMYWGLSPFLPSRKAILFNRFTSEYLNNYYLKGATPGLSLEMASDANEKNATRLLRTFEAAYTGRTNQRRTLVLPKGVTAKQIAHTLADQQLKDYILLNREDILAVLKVPKHEVGLQTAGSLGSEEYKTALKNFWASTIIPMQNLIASSFNRSYRALLGDMFFCAFDNSNVEILKDNEIEKANVAAGMLKTHTINEVRGKLYKIDPIQDGDTIPGMNQQPWSPVNFGYFGDNVKAKADTDKIVEVLPIKENAADFVIKNNAGWFEEHKKRIQEATEKPENELIKSVIKMFSDQSVAVIKKLGDIMPKTKTKDTEEFIKELIKVEIIFNSSDFLKEYIDIAHGVSIAGWLLGGDSPVRNPDLNIEITDKNKKELTKDLDKRAKNSFAFMSETTTNDIYRIIKEGIDNSDTTQQVAIKISDLFANPDKIMARAQNIARTEILSALSIGKSRQMKEAATIVPDLKKMWISTEDNRTRGNPSGLYAGSDSDHWGLHGQIVNHDKDFTDPRSREKLSFPRDPKGSASAVINCRCTWIILPANEMEKISNTETEVQPHD